MTISKRPRRRLTAKKLTGDAIAAATAVLLTFIISQSIIRVQRSMAFNAEQQQAQTELLQQILEAQKD